MDDLASLIATDQILVEVTIRLGSTQLSVAELSRLRPDDIPPGQECPIHIRIIPGGEVIAATVLPGCPYSDEAKRSVEKAVRDASPLPFKGYEDAYSRDFTANFRPSR